MNTATIRTIVRTQLLTTPDLPTVRWEQMPHTAPPTSNWLEDELRLTAGNKANGLTEARGLYLLTLHTAPDRVLADLDSIADRLARQFEPGRVLIDAARTHQIECTSLDLGATRRVDSWGYRRLAVGFSAVSFRTSQLSA